MQSRKCSKVLVVGVSDDLRQRMLFEDVFANELQRTGVNTLQSYLVMVGPELTREKVVNAVKTVGSDCVITTRLVSRQQETKVIPGSETIGVTSPGPETDPDYFIESLTVVETPPTVITDTRTTVESRLFEAATARMVWSMKASALNVGKLAPVTKEYVKLIANDLKKNGLM